MSVQALAWVLDHSRAEKTARLVLLSLANHAGVDGDSTYPSIATMARQARCGESTVRKALETLQAIGEIEEIGTSPKGTRSFRINMAEAAPDPRPVRARPGQKAPHERKLQESETPAEAAPPQELRPPAGLSTAPPQLLRSTPAGTAAEPSMNRTEGTVTPLRGRTTEVPSRLSTLCDQLADAVSADGSPRPNPRTKKWTDACRLLIDRDHATPEQVSDTIEWLKRGQSKDAEFWQRNVLSMPKLRQHWTRLRKIIASENPTAFVGESAEHYARYDQRAEVTA
jgi:hypothetical protein